MDKTLIPEKIQVLAEQGTPFLYIDQEQLKVRCNLFLRSFKEGVVYYSVKANSDPSVLQILAEHGLGFDVASWDEISKLLKLSVSSDRMIFSAPTKLPFDIVSAYKHGIRRFAFDSELELKKIATLAPYSDVFVRITVSNEGSEWPLERKFGVSKKEIVPLFQYAKSLRLNPIGISFHVGSQNLVPMAWSNALKDVKAVKTLLENAGFELKLINMGGGFPVHYTKDVPSIPDYAKVINTTLINLGLDSIDMIIEPGRSMISEAGTLAASVINRASRGDEEWLYLDVGVFHGMQETVWGFQYELVSDSKSLNTIPYTIGGPTCDSTDHFMPGVHLPDDLTLGNKIYIRSTGAYTTSLEHYNGIMYPSIILG